MCPTSKSPGARRPGGTVRGFTLMELMLGLTVSSMLVAGLSVLAMTVNESAEYNSGQNEALQHAQVVLERIQRTIGDAYAAENYPGAVVVAEVVNSYSYPDTLVIWHPAGGTPANTAGPPLVSELVIICPDPNDAGSLCEITAPSDSRTIELNDASLNTSSGWSTISGIKTANSSVKTKLTPLLQTAPTSNNSGAQLRGAVRFVCELHPSASDLSAVRSGSGDWNDLPWVQGLFSSSVGMRQVWVRSEVQLLSEPRHSDGSVSATAVPVPFLGSAALYYTITE